MAKMKYVEYKKTGRYFMVYPNNLREFNYIQIIPNWGHSCTIQSWGVVVDNRISAKKYLIKYIYEDN